MSDRTVRRIFILVLIFLPLQYIAVGIVGYYDQEPWPAFVFPGFKNVNEDNGKYKVQEIRFVLYNENGDKVSSVKPYLFFPVVPRSQMGGLLRSTFLKQDSSVDFSDESRDFLRQNSHVITKKNITRLHVVRTTKFVSNKAGGIEVDSLHQELVEKIYFNE